MDEAKRDPLDQIRLILPGSRTPSNASEDEIRDCLRAFVIGHRYDRSRNALAELAAEFVLANSKSPEGALTEIGFFLTKFHKTVSSLCGDDDNQEMLEAIWRAHAQRNGGGT